MKVVLLLMLLFKLDLLVLGLDMYPYFGFLRDDGGEASTEIGASSYPAPIEDAFTSASTAPKRM